MNAFPLTLFSASALRAITVAAALFSPRAQADAYVEAYPGAYPSAPEIETDFPGPDHRSPPAAGRLAGAGGGGTRQAAEVRPRPGVPAMYSQIKYAFFCFGPMFGNGSRGVDPNFMPPPTASDDVSRDVPAPARVRYTRLQSSTPGKAVWIGSDGSRISYTAGPSHRENRESGAKSERPSVADLIAENRKEMAKISWERVYRRFPELERQDSSERVAFEAFLAEKQADPSEAAAFERPMWPEEISSAFMTEWNWRKAEAESWERICAKVRIFNDPESAYTRRFLSFAAGLRTDPEGMAIFNEPTWPEKALELHDQRFGPVPPRFR